MSCPDPDLERCKKSLRSVLLAFKDGLPMRLVSKEYSNLFEEDIQFSKFKFQSLGKGLMLLLTSSLYFLLEKFLQSIPDVCTLRQRRGEVVVEGVGTKATNHIKSLVQNTGKKKGSGWAGNWREPQREALTRSSPLRESKQSPTLATRKKSSQTFGFIGPVKPGPESNIPLEVTNDSFKGWANKVTQILRGRPDGLTEDQVDLLYQAQYRARLPHVWTRALTKAGLIDVDTENKVNTKPLIFPAAHNLTPVVIPAIRSPVKRDWDVVVNSVDSKRQEAWVTLQDGASLKTRHQLQLQMKHCSSRTKWIVLPGEYLSAWLQPDHFERVQVVKVNRVNSTCRCFLIDQGREMEFDWGVLADLPPGCLTVPAQAIKIRLAGFDNYTNNQFAEFVMDKLEGKRFLGRLVEGSSTSDLPELRIFDADKKSEVQFVDEAITQMKGLKLSACQAQQEPQLESQRLPEEGDFYDCKVSHVVSPDEIWVQEYSTLHHYDVMKRSAAAFYSLGNGRVVQDPQPGAPIILEILLRIYYFQGRS